MKKRTENIEKNITKGIRAFSIDFLRGVTIATPKDTGRATANWFVSIGSPILKSNDELFDKTGSETAAKGASVIAKYQSNSGSIFITNNLTYIGFLNAGSSTKAPPMFVEKQLQLTARRIKDIKVVGV